MSGRINTTNFQLKLKPILQKNIINDIKKAIKTYQERSLRVGLRGRKLNENDSEQESEDEIATIKPIKQAKKFQRRKK